MPKSKTTEQEDATGLICQKCGFAKIIRGKKIENKNNPSQDCDWPLREMTYTEVKKYEQI